MKICLLPNPPKSPQTGGVTQFLYGLAIEFNKLGHEIVFNPKEADVVHGHAFDGADHVYTSHGVYPEPSDINETLYNNIARADIVTAVSKWTADQFAHLNVNARIINNGVDINSLSSLRRKPEGYVIWAKSGLTPVSNEHYFIELAKSRPDMRFMMTVAPNILIPRNVKVIGKQNYHDMMNYIAGASVYVSTGTENFPIQVLEAMALGVPVLAMPFGGVKEVNGIELSENLKDGLENCFINHDSMVRNQDRCIGEYNFEVISKKYIEAYKDAQRIKHTHKVSVIIPVHNYASLVGRAIDSCLKQTEKPDEIIVIDDGSTDDIDKSIKPYTNKVKFVKQKNAGVSATRNRGVKMSSGEFICCLDADDYLSPDFIKKAKKILIENKGVGIAYPGLLVTSDSGESADLEGMDYSFSKLKASNFIPCANLHRRVAFERCGGDKNINPSWEDYELWLNISEHGFYGKRVVGERLFYRTHGHGRTGEEMRGNHSNLLRAKVDGYHPRLYGNSALVSFVIPCYNQWNYLRDAVMSAWEQTYPHIEVIVVDDFSTEKDKSVYDKILSEFPNTRFLFRQTNGGLSSARNTGIQNATGEWIVPLDSDDKVDKEFVSECMKVAYRGDKYAYTDIYVWHNEGRGPTEEYKSQEYSCKTLMTRHLHACTILISKKWVQGIGGYDENMRDGWEDYEFALRLAKAGQCGERIQKCLFYYRWRPNSMRQKAEQISQKINDYIWNKHSDLRKKGFEMACCGNKVPSKVINAPVDLEQMAMDTPGGSTLVVYSGSRSGQMTKQGGGHRLYKYSSTHPSFYVHNSDVSLFSTHPKFRIVKKTTTPVRVVKPVVAREELVESMSNDTDDLTTIEGITPEIASVLYNMGVTSYERFIALRHEDVANVFTKPKLKKAQSSAIVLVRKEAGVA